MRKHKILALLLVFIIGIMPTMPVFAEDGEVNIISYRLIIEGFDWGPAVTRVVLELDNPATEITELYTSDFSLQFERRTGFVAPFWGFEDETIIQDAAITNVFISDENEITLELLVHPSLGVNPFTFTFVPMGNDWSDPFNAQITWNGVTFEPTREARIIPIADEFTKDLFFEHEDTTLVYGFFTPPEARTSERPLIIWLHGGGEGSMGLTAGTDSALLGNRVTQLAAPEIQGLMGGAHVLVPQAPSMWLAGSGENNGVSDFEDALMAFIDYFIETTPNIDLNRIYIGGCSNGGFMTIRALFLRPDLFAASFPICMAYDPDYILPGQIESIAHIPMWLIHDQDDPTTPHEHSQNIYDLLAAAGLENLHFTTTQGIFSDEFFDEDGEPHQFDSHWSWIPVLNNEVFNEQGQSIFEWMALQTLATEIEGIEIVPMPIPTMPVSATFSSIDEFDANGELIQSPFRNIAGSGLVDYRAIDYIIGWETNTGDDWISFTNAEGIEIRIAAGSHYAQVDGQSVEMLNAQGASVQARLINGVLFVPIRFFHDLPIIPISIEWFEGEGVIITRE